MKAKKIVARLLLGFVLVSVGFSLGREVTLRSVKVARSPAPPPGAATAPADTGAKVIVYYMHPTRRCATCSRIEKMSRDVVEREFAEQLRDGRVEWRVVNYQEEEDLAERYKVASSSLVVVEVRNGRQAGFERLDDVWALGGDPGAFGEYVGGAIRSRLEGGED